MRITDAVPVKYPHEYKDVDGHKCPDIYMAYDMTSYDCIHCGHAKLYTSCRYYEDRAACNGWVHSQYGPVSCKGYVQAEEERRDFL